MESDTIDEGVQADLPEPDKEEDQLKIRPLERIKLHPKVPIEKSAYGKGKNFSRDWILQDGREVPAKGSEMRDSFRVPKKPKHGEGQSVLIFSTLSQYLALFEFEVPLLTTYLVFCQGT